MESGPPSRPTPDLSADEEQALTDFVVSCETAFSLVRAVSEHEWTASTPCSEWDLFALVNHMIGSARMVAFGVKGRLIGPEFYGNHLGSNPVSSYRAAIDDAVGAYRSDPGALSRMISMPWGTLSGAQLAVMFAADHLVHAWDVATSLGMPIEVEDALVARIRDFGDDYVAAHRGPEMFGEEVQPAPDASALDRLAAFVGRRPFRRNDPATDTV